MLVPRLIYTETRFHARESIGSIGLDSFLGQGSLLEYLEEYKQVFHGVVLQDIAENELTLVSIGDIVVFSPGYTSFCKWHTGPLEHRDDPLKRVYCRRSQYIGLGYCREHSESYRAVYDRCFSTAGQQGIRYCIELDHVMKGKMRYSIYIIDYGRGFKVGVTRKWRLLDRVGEQPHVVATELLDVESAFKAREIEIRIGAREQFTERPHKRVLKDVISYPPRVSLRRLRNVASKLAKLFGVEYEGRIFRITPYNCDVTDFMKAKEKKLVEVSGRRMEVRGYWMGYLLLSEVDSGSYYIVRARDLLHRDTVALVK